MSLRPLQDRLIVRRGEPELRTAGGIVLPGSAGEKPEQGEIVAVGPGKRGSDGGLVVPQVRPGDRILFGQYAGQTVKVDGHELLVIREDDVLAVIED